MAILLTITKFDQKDERQFNLSSLVDSAGIYSSPLGACATNPNSLTSIRGSLGLAPVGSVSVGESPSFLESWLEDDLQKASKQRIFPLIDILLTRNWALEFAKVQYYFYTVGGAVSVRD
ncbi:hypothetical protein Q8A67_000049 [Cirrhinus molitorella]|uniref:Uncharacterized protein n=1 Tax=Cirrhinus molitorella TaxID=172907 RepID=A0AA88QE74_9TELE|nr:hypothetical protein Q8A67_000049 [Cirrhinus molitorella]